MAKKLTMEQLEELLAETIKKTVSDMGLDRVDKKFGVAPTEEDPNGEEAKNLDPKERVAKFFRAVIRRDFATLKALGEGTDSEGGYLVPTEFRAEIVRALPEITVMRPLSRVIPVTSYTGEMPTLTGKPTATWGSENTAIGETSATFGQLTWTLSRLQALIPLSRELVADANIDIVNFIQTLFAESFAETEDEAFTNGDGSGKPTGFRNASGVTALAQSGSALSLNDVIALFNALPQKYRRRATFMTSGKGMQLLRGLTDSNGRPLLYTPADGDVNMLFGRPIVQNDNIPENLGTNSDETELWFGDFGYYYIFDRGEYVIDSTTDGAGAFEKNQVIIKATNRVDAKLALAESFAKLTGVK